MGSAKASSFIQNQLLVAGCSLFLTGLALFLHSIDRTFCVSGEQVSESNLQESSRPLLGRLLLDVLISFVLFRITSHLLDKSGTRTFFCPSLRECSMVRDFFEPFGRAKVEQSILCDDEYTAAPVDFLRTFGHGL